jgi:hypothetical protein
LGRARNEKRGGGFKENNCSLVLKDEWSKSTHPLGGTFQSLVFQITAQDKIQMNW